MKGPGKSDICQTEIDRVHVLNGESHCVLQYSTVQYSTAQYSAVPGVGADVGAMLTVGADVSIGVGLAVGEQDPPVL